MMTICCGDEYVIDFLTKISKLSLIEFFLNFGVSKLMVYQNALSNNNQSTNSPITIINFIGNANS